MRFKVFALALVFGAADGIAQTPAGSAKSMPTVIAPAATPLEDRVVTLHSVKVGNTAIPYRAIAGTLLLRNKAGEPAATMFYVAYEKADVDQKKPRPVTFCFNGGPGSSSMWLHIGSIGPQRIVTSVPGQPAAEPHFGPNPYTLLGKTDLVFLDAIGTGFSRSLSSSNKEFWGNDEDTASFAQAIERYLTVNQKWNAPKFLFGESYGTTRSAMLAPLLEDKRIKISGIVMMSTILNFAHFAPGLDRAAIDLLPSYAATALFHRRIPPFPGGVEPLTQAARVFAQGQYAAALAEGDRISEEERAAVAAKLHDFTGLPVAYLERANLRVGIDQFRREVLGDPHRSIGATDTRFQGQEASGIGDQASFDPADTAIASDYVQALNSYVRETLGYKTPLTYIPSDSRTIMGQWDWSHQPTEGERQGSLADTVPDLALAMRHDPEIRLLSLNGWYDLMTPFFGTEFDLAHLWLGGERRGRITYRYYPSGHLLYIDERIMPALLRDLDAFYDDKRP